MTVNNSEGNADNTMTTIDWNELLDPLPLPMETGYRRLDDGTLHIAARTDMHDCKTAMFEWWFRWRCDTQKYIWWHPIDHVSSHWAGDLSPDTHVGSEHIVVERFADAPAAELVIQFHGADDVFDAERYRTAVDRGDVSGSVLGRVGTGHHRRETHPARSWAVACCTSGGTLHGGSPCAATSTSARICLQWV